MRVVVRELPTIEAAREAGLTYEQIAAGLTSVGSPVSARVLRELVYRARRRRRNASAGAASHPVTARPATTAAIDAPPGSPQPTAPVATLGSAAVALPRTGSPAPLPPHPTRASSDGPVGADDFITEILRTPPDLDALARRFHESRRKGTS